VDDAAFASGTRALPEDHLWGPRDYYKSAYYRTAVAHFASEIGYLGCPAVESLRRFLSPEWLWPYTDNPEWLLHATSPFPGVDTHDYRVELIASQVRALFGVIPDTLEDFVLASQACQAEALKFFIESFRAGKWRRTGIVWWNLLDGWPQFSDAVVDHYFVRKRAFEVVRRAQAPICLILREPQSGVQELVVSNDTREDVIVSFAVTDVPSGRTLVRDSMLAARDAVVSCGSIGETGRQTLYLLTWESRLGAGRSHYLAGDPPFSLDDYRAWMGLAGL
jgi:beta-mannosidase